MIEVAEEILKRVQKRVKTTVKTVVSLADAFGVTDRIASFIRSCSECQCDSTDDQASSNVAPPISSPPVVESTMPPTTPPSKANGRPATTKARTTQRRPKSARPKTQRGSGRRQPPEGDTKRSAHVKRLKVSDTVDSSTYLARIVWCLGVAELEGTAPLKPADIARMVMARSPVSLEPPNIARYIRRSNPDAIVVAHNDGGSNFYALSPSGKVLFQEKFVRA